MLLGPRFDRYLWSSHVGRFWRHRLDSVYGAQNRCKSSHASARVRVDSRASFRSPRPQRLLHVFARNMQFAQSSRPGQAAYKRGDENATFMQSQEGSTNLTEWLYNWSTGLKIGANRAEPRPGSFPSPRGRVWPGSGPESAICGLTPPSPKKTENRFDCIGDQVVASPPLLVRRTIHA
jgi:hypothetical protein